MLQDFTKQIEKTVETLINEIHTALPGEIVSFDTSKGTAIIQPVGKFITSDGKVLDYPRITEVPLVFPYCHQTGVGIALPVKKGDSCIIIISEVELDEWRSGGKSEGSLRFDLTSAVAIPGLLKTGGQLFSKAVNNNAVVIGSSGASVSVSNKRVDMDVKGTTFSVSESGITVGGNLTVKGNITSTEDVKAGEISLKQHTHISAEPEKETGKAQ